MVESLLAMQSVAGYNTAYPGWQHGSDSWYQWLCWGVQVSRMPRGTPKTSSRVFRPPIQRLRRLWLSREGFFYRTPPLPRMPHKKDWGKIRESKSRGS